MRCDIRPTDDMDHRGFRRYKCNRRRCIWKVWKPPWSDVIDARCRGWPYWWEIGHWIALRLEAWGITKPRYARFLGKDNCQPCDEREAALNSGGRWLDKLVSHFIRAQSRSLPWPA